MAATFCVQPLDPVSYYQCMSWRLLSSWTYHLNDQHFDGSLPPILERPSRIAPLVSGLFLFINAFFAPSVESPPPIPRVG